MAAIKNVCVCVCVCVCALPFFIRTSHVFRAYLDTCRKKKVKAVCGSYSTAALRHVVLLPE